MMEQEGPIMSCQDVPVFRSAPSASCGRFACPLLKTSSLLSAYGVAQVMEGRGKGASLVLDKCDLHRAFS